MIGKLSRTILASAAALLTLFTLPALAQTPLTPVGQLVANKGTLVAGDVTFSNFTLPSTVIFTPGPLDGVGNIAASAAVNPDGTVSLTFTAIDPATGTPSPITSASQQVIAYDVTVTNPLFLLSSVNQQFGPASTIGFNFFLYRAPAPSVISTDDEILFDSIVGTGQQTARGGALLSFACLTANNPDGSHCPSSLPGGNRAAMGLENFFGFTTDNRFGFPPPPVGTFSLDSIAMTFTLVPANTPVTPIPVTLGGIEVSHPGIGWVSLANTVDPVDSLKHPGFAPAGGSPVTLTTSNASALPLPATITMPQGAEVTVFNVGNANVDGPTPVTATATLNGVTVSQNVTVNPTVPLALNFFAASLQTGAGGAIIPNAIQLGASINRLNFALAVISLTSSNPAIAPVPASLSVPALTSPGDCRFECVNIATVPVGADTTVTFTASLNGGAPLSSSVTIPKTVDAVAVTKAELVVKNLSLKVEATSTQPTATLTLFNAATGQFVGTMTNLGRGKYSFQGTVSPVTTLLLTSSLNGTATGAVAQK